MPSDVFAEAEAIADDLDSDGRSDLAVEIREAIASGSTGTEIMMALRWNLEQLLASEPNLGTTAAKMRALLNAVEVALR